LETLTKRAATTTAVMANFMGELGMFKHEIAMADMFQKF
jgi:hypothetical protein